MLGIGPGQVLSMLSSPVVAWWWPVVFYGYGLAGMLWVGWAINSLTAGVSMLSISCFDRFRLQGLAAMVWSEIRSLEIIGGGCKGR